MIDMEKKACKQAVVVVETRSEEWEASEEVSVISHEEMQMTSSPNSSVVEIHLQTSSMTMGSMTSLAVLEDVADRDNNNSNNSNNINSSSLTASREDETHSVAVSEEVSSTTSMMTSEVGSEASAEACSVEVQ